MRRFLIVSALAMCAVPLSVAAGPAGYVSCTPAQEGGITTCTSSLPPGYSIDSWYASPSPGTTCDFDTELGAAPFIEIEVQAVGLYAVCLQYTSELGTGISSTTVTVSNAVPLFLSAWINPDPVAGYATQVLTADFEEWSTPTCTVDFGDGTSQVSGQIGGSAGYWYCDAPPHVYASANTYKVTFSAKESDGGVTISYTQPFTVIADPYMYVDQVSVSWKSGRTVTWTGIVRIVDPAGAGLPKASVKVDWFELDATGGRILPAVATSTALTSRSGVAKFTARFATGKYYTLCVSDGTDAVTNKAAWDYRTDYGKKCASYKIPPP